MYTATEATPGGDLSRQQAVIDHLLARCGSLSPADIGLKLVENNVLKRTDLARFLALLEEKLPGSGTYGAILNFLVTPEKADPRLERPENWRVVPKMLSATECAPLLYRGMRKLPPGHFARRGEPGEVFEACRRAYEAASAANRKKLDCLTTLIREFARRDIPLIPLKGSFLAFTCYPDPGCRPMGDIDLLIRPQDTERSRRLLQDLGCRPREKGFVHGFYRRYHYHQSYTFRDNEGHATCLEVHWSPFLPFLPISASLEDLWRRSFYFSGKTLSTQTLALEDQLIYLAYHFEKHCLFLDGLLRNINFYPALFSLGSKARLKWLTDLYFLIKKEKSFLDWQQVTSRALSWNLVHPLHTTLLLLEKIFSPLIPAAALLELKKHDEPPCSTMVRKGLFQLRTGEISKNSLKNKALKKLLFNSKKNLPLQFGPRSFPEIVWYIVPNRNFFIQQQRPFTLWQRIVHALRSSGRLSLIMINTALFLALSGRQKAR